MTCFRRFIYLAVILSLNVALMLGQEVRPETPPPGVLRKLQEIYSHIELFERLLLPEKGSLASLSHSPEKLAEQQAEVAGEIGLSAIQRETLIGFAERYKTAKADMSAAARNLHLQQPDPSSRTEEDRDTSKQIFADYLMDVDLLVTEFHEKLGKEGTHLVEAYIEGQFDRKNP